MAHKRDKGAVHDADSQAAISLKYRNYIEEMELRIRYMKNDIEFKKTQMKSLPPSLEHKSSTNVGDVTNLIPHKTSSSSCSDPYHSLSSLADRKSQHKTSGKQCVQNRKWTRPSVLTNDHQTGHSNNLIVSRHNHPRTVSAPTPVPSPTVVQRTLCLNSAKVRNGPVPAVTSKTLFQNRETMDVKATKDAVLRSTPYSSILPKSSENTRTVLSVKSRRTQNPTNMGSTSLSSDVRTVLLPFQSSASVPCCSTNSVPLFTASLKSVTQSRTYNKGSSVSVPMSEQGVGTAKVSESPAHNHKPQILTSQYKFVKTHLSPPNIVQVSCGPSTFSVPSTSQNQSFVVSTRDDSDDKKLTAIQNQSKIVQSGYKDVSAVLCDTPNQKHSRGNKRLIRKTPHLKLQTAAKVVSKYKLKRLSPTAGLKSAPELFPAHKVNRALLKLDRRCEQQERSVTCNVSPHKLDRRPNKVIGNQHKLGERFRTDSGIVHFSNFYVDENLKNRNIVTTEKQGTFYSSKSQKFSTDNKRHFDKKFEIGKPIHNNPHKLDRRNQREAIVSSGSQGLTLTPKRNCGHLRTKSAVNKSPFSTKVKKEVLKRRQQTNKFVWRRLTKAENCATSSSGLMPSKFSWFRPGSRRNMTSPVLRRQQDLKLAQWKRFQRTSVLRNHHQTGKPETGKFRLCMIDGQLYKASNSKLTKAKENSSSILPAQGKMKATNFPSQAKKKSPIIKNLRQRKLKLISVRGILFQVDAACKRLCRTNTSSTSPSGSKTKLGGTSKSVVEIQGVQYVKARPQALGKVINDKTRLAASRAVYRSLAIAAAKYKKDNRKHKIKKKYCIFFGRFGKCHRGNKCPFIHDVDKVALCTRFLRGKCDVLNCPFSHQASAQKMPVCLFYLRGSCVRADCPYLHVNVNPEAPVCKDFLNGFCAAGEKCKDLHSYVCPSFAATGTCHRGENCPMFHRRSKNLEAVTSSQKTLAKVLRKEKGAKRMRRSLSESNVMKLEETSSSHRNVVSPSRSSCQDDGSSLLSVHQDNASSSLSSLRDNTSSPLLFSHRDNILSLDIVAQPSFISLGSSPAIEEVSHLRPQRTPSNSVKAPLTKKPKITPCFVREDPSSSLIPAEVTEMSRSMDQEAKMVVDKSLLPVSDPKAQSEKAGRELNT
ncbi:uncharacterized protein LOC101851178 [Aplysia californica]|uniref:Uncharacterized protein LOC101851178 n=1 Tax=Aplysia californica TaxID=6500 RepID=A0ABM0JGP2_APLCA|nr:uncharacterized protein LOC101851178 [Aplysia californica]